MGAFVRKKNSALCLGVFMLICADGPLLAADSAAIQVTETNQAYELTVPVSRLVLTIPKADFTRAETDQGGTGGSPRYFVFRHKSLNLTIDGWFEPAERFPGLKKVWEEKLNVFTRTGRRPPEEVSLAKIGRWKSVTYVIPDPALPLITSEISAHWLQAGTWIELHLSLTSPQTDKESAAKLEKLLKTIQVKEKK
jgi:hypothetical protein